MTENKPNYNTNQGTYANTYGEPQYPANYTYRSTNDLYEEDNSGTGSFLAGAIIGGVIGAATALFLAPKTGREMREDFTTQAAQLKDKSIELSSTAKDKAIELSSTAKDKTADWTDVAKEKTAAFTSAAKDKSSELSQTIQEQSGQLVDKVKSVAGKTNIPMDDGTVSSEGEEATEYKSMKESKEESGKIKKADQSVDQNEKEKPHKNVNPNKTVSASKK
ncbi:YtxH domain-containing protein [Mammaliicoccus sciuri]|uniref:Gas vesicle protein n=1 Tax=Sporosarcina newyorkensis TaxID=759851 RepID=A0A1T4XRM6_9BACL|nr:MULTISPECIES: YtxH domain-containing protein [Sporosarcina]MBY0222309.1 YtxH domain-containing protein [Sporosarcina aquimarina]SKA92210.1 Gas vesicle protein [Sporosarcina newyorkensis]